MKVQHEHIEHGAVAVALLALSAYLTRLSIKIARNAGQQPENLQH